MDRIDSMDAKDKDAALRRLIAVGGRVADCILRQWVIHKGSDMDRDLRAALAAFDPTPLDVAKAALEKAGFVREAFSTRHRGCVCIHEFNDPNIVLWYALPKESP